jgi:ribosomal protein S18 acetylase RimI-like enzyme
MTGFTIRALADADRPWANALLETHWGSTRIVSRGVVHDLADYPGFVAVQDDERIGLLTYHITRHETGDQCEITSLDSLRENRGVGSALIEAARAAAQDAGCVRLWLITTNDNLRAIGFYQKRCFALVAVHRNALEQARQIKPQIPHIGLHGIPLRDEIEFEQLL